MLRLTVDKTQTLKEFTENNYAQAGFYFQTLLKAREIKVNGKRVNGDISVYVGDEVCYYLTAKQAEKPAFYRVYEDENVCVVDKESGVNSEAVFAALCREGRYYFIHRLDRNTKGLLIFARTENAEVALLQAFKAHTVEKRYHALCFGVLPKEEETLTAYLKKDAQKSIVRVYDTPVQGSEKIITEYKVLRRLKETTQVEVILHTGKTHQIRAHFAHIGCPLVGDMKYGNSEHNKAFKASRQALVAKSLRVQAEGELSYLKERTFTSRYEV